MVESLDELKQTLPGTIQHDQAWQRLLDCDPDVDRGLTRLLVDAAPLARHERRLLKPFGHPWRGRNELRNEPAWERYEAVNIAVRRYLKAQLAQRGIVPGADRSGLALGGVLTPTVINHWYDTAIVGPAPAQGSYEIRMLAHINVPKALQEAGTGSFYLPTRWDSDDLATPLKHVNVTVTLTSAVPLDQEYILWHGTRVVAKVQYQKLQAAQAQPTVWQRLFGTKPLSDYATWLKGQARVNLPVVPPDPTWVQAGMLPEPIQDQMREFASQVEEQFNVLWHELLHHDRANFGQPTLKIK